MDRDKLSEDLEFEALIEKFNEPEKFLARQIREVKIECQKRKYCAAFTFSRRQVLTGIGGVVAICATLIGIAEALVRIFS